MGFIIPSLKVVELFKEKFAEIYPQPKWGNWKGVYLQRSPNFMGFNILWKLVEDLF